MSRTWKKLLSVLLALSMIASLVVTGYAEPASADTASDDTFVGTELELEPMDPGKLNVPQVGQLEDDATQPEEEKLPYGPNDVVRVSIILDKAATLDAYSAEDVADNNRAMSYRHGLQKEQSSLTAKIERAIGSELDVKWNLTLAINAISANVRFGDIETIKTVKGVKSVELENRYDPMVDDPNTSISTEHMVFATNAWADGYTGAGSRVAIIDTGTNQDHISFDPAAFDYSLRQGGHTAAELDLLDTDEIADVLDELNANNSAAKHEISDVGYVYKNEKIPFAYNYVDGNNTTDHYSDKQGEHGSHVSGIAAANRYIRDGKNFVEAATSDKSMAVGVAPDAQILTMKVFGAGGGAYDSDYMAAIEDAIILRADSINLSLGSGAPGFVFAGTYQEVMDKLVESDSVVCISAGNSYAWTEYLEYLNDLYAEDVSMHTGGSPGTFINSLGVAAAQNVGMTGTPLVFNGELISYFTEAHDYANQPIKSVPGEYEYVYVDGPGNAEEFEAVNEELSLDGKVVLCNRGAISFYVKGNNALPFNPAAIVIVNNQPGTINMNLEGYKGPVPMVSITQADGNTLKERGPAGTVYIGDENDDDAEEVNYYTGTVTITDKLSAGVDTDLADATITGFSSWGVPGALIMKPEITAPGGSIWSVNGMTDDDYEDMSGTSMAAPHVTGMAAILGQYVRENNLTEKTGMSARHLINSLLMSTATPMKNDGKYLPVLQQGAGLGNVYAATQATSYITMGEDANIAYADGKVKVEFGQDAERTGDYTYTFTVNNMSENNLLYELSTDMFTQAVYEDEGDLFMDRSTRALDADVTYDWEQAEVAGPDVDKDGDVDYDDAQAILDFVTGLLTEDEIDTTAADRNEDGEITSYDAHLMLQWLDNQPMPENGKLLVPANGAVTVTVNIKLTDAEKATLDEQFVNGAYIEGFTYAKCTSTTTDGALMDVEHSIPILGFYGNWTDPSMFDNTSAVDVAYGTDTKIPYTLLQNTNYMTIRNSRGSGMYLGNPYRLEDEFPAERLAVNNATTFVDAKYTMLRNAATVVPMVIDEEGNVLYNGNASGNVFGAWYYVNQGTWQARSINTAKMGVEVKNLGLKDGDKITAGVFAVPEYYAIMLDSQAKAGALKPDQIAQLYTEGQIGEGALMGYTFTVDTEAPEILSAKLSKDGSQISVTAKDNHYIAYLGIMDVTGNVEFVGTTPDQETENEKTSTTFVINGLDLGNAVAVFAGDYAGNESASLIRINDGPVIGKKLMYVLTDTLEEGKNYILATSNELGQAKAINIPDNGKTFGPVEGVDVTIEDLNGKMAIDPENVAPTAVWTPQPYRVPGSWYIANVGMDGKWMGYSSINDNSPVYFWSMNYDRFVYGDNKLSVASYSGNKPVVWSEDAGLFIFHSTAPGNIYLYTEELVDVVVDPENASAVTVDPAEARLILGVQDTIQLNAKVEPLVLPDKTVTWTSADETIATVDENGVVTAVGAGVTTITAASNATPEVTGTCQVTVVESVPLDAVLGAQVSFGDDKQFTAIDLNTMETAKLGDAESDFLGGGQGGTLIWGNDTDFDYWKYDMANEFASEYQFAINTSYAIMDGAAIPNFTVTDENGNSMDTDYCLTAVSPVSYLELLTAEGNLSYFNLSSLGNFVGICFAGYNKDEAGAVTLYYYALTDDAKVYAFAISGELDGEDIGLNLGYGVVGQITDLPMGEDPFAFSIEYAVGPTYGGDQFPEGVDGLIIGDNNGKCFYFVNFEDAAEDATEFPAQYVGQIKGATNLSCLFDNGFDALDVVPARAAAAIEKSDAQPMKAENGSLFAAANESTGSLNATIGAESARAERPVGEVNNVVVDDTTEPGVVTMDIVEEIGITNGLYTLSYRPELMTFVEITSDAKLTSVNVDEANGIVTFALANSDELPAGEPVAVAKFNSEVKQAIVTVTTEERNDEVIEETYNGWKLDEDGTWSFYDEEGNLVTGWMQYGTRDAWYYFDENGVMQTGWIQYGTNNAWYYLDPEDGYMHTGWVQYGTNHAWYYMGTDGAMKTGWQLVDGKWYFLKDNGVMKTGWLLDGGKWYYLNPNGDMAVSKWIGNYYVKADGTMAVSEWVDNDRYYVDENGLWVPGKTK